MISEEKMILILSFPSSAKNTSHHGFFHDFLFSDIFFNFYSFINFLGVLSIPIAGMEIRGQLAGISSYTM